MKPLAWPSNPRWQRALAGLIRGALMREELDRLVGASNSPHVVSELRRAFGLEIPCERIAKIDRDGRSCAPGRYSLSMHDRDLLASMRIEPDAKLGGN